MSLTKKDKAEIREMIKEFKELLGSNTLVRMVPAFDPNKAETVHSKLLDAKVSLEDYYEYDENGNKKTEFTFDEVLEIDKKLPEGWRVATRHEWCLLAEEFGYNTKTGELDPDLLVKNLNLTRNEDGVGYYWSSTAYNANLAYRLSLYSSGVYPQSGDDKSYGFSVRCVRDKEET